MKLVVDASVVLALLVDQRTSGRWAAELVGAPLATLDVRLARSPGIRCEIRTP